MRKMQIMLHSVEPQHQPIHCQDQCCIHSFLAIRRCLVLSQLYGSANLFISENIQMETVSREKNGIKKIRIPVIGRFQFRSNEGCADTRTLRTCCCMFEFFSGLMKINHDSRHHVLLNETKFKTIKPFIFLNSYIAYFVPCNLIII